jgi:hypothetical protein
MSDSADRQFWWLFLPETIVHFVLGAATLGVGSFAVVRWSIDQWADGSRADVVGVAIAATAFVCVFVVAARGRRLVLAGAAVVAWVGVVAYILAGYGFSIPPDWLP